MSIENVIKFNAIKYYLFFEIESQEKEEPIGGS